MRPDDEKPFAITLEVGSSLANKTGSWRVERPVYVDRLPPCNNACPAGENIQQWLYLAEDGSYEAAWRQIMRDNPLPAVMGRACFHPCQTACNRAELDETVGINAMERFLGDQAIERRLGARPGRAADRRGGFWWSAPGPGGMSAAYHLRLPRPCRGDIRGVAAAGGHDALRHPGLPVAAGHRGGRDQPHRGHGSGDRVRADGRRPEATMSAGGFDAAFLAVGAQRGRNADIPAGDSARILDAVSLLRDSEET